MGPHLLLTRSPLDRGLDACLGLTAIVWSVLGIVHDHDLPLGVRVALCAVNVVVGVLFIVRSGSAEQAPTSDILRALPSVVASGIAYRCAAHDWPPSLVALHAAFALVALISLATLGRSFAILPARRALVAKGPYRLVRHPIYLAELGMLVTACASRGWIAASLCAIGVALVLAPRILVEERMLAADEAYGAYRARVRWRLLPGLF